MPLDDNLPTFFLAKSQADDTHRTTYYLARGGSDPEPVYSLRYAEPAASKNCYAVALFDAYNSEVLFGEVLLRPQWTHPTVSQEEIRRNGGVPPPPEPMMPHEFTVQLYNPDQQITITHKDAALSSKWEFSMPQDTFRAPSGSMLDRSQNDPGAASTTPRINFAWKRENKFSKELVCYMRGKSTDVISRKKSKEPDITVAMLKSLKQLTIYEPNLYRVEMEDSKGLEVALLLSTVVLRDVFFSSNIRQTFNVSEAARGQSVSSPRAQAAQLPGPPLRSSNSAALNGLYQPNNPTPQANDPQPPLSRPPPADPRTQWEIDAETQRLKVQAQTEQRERRRQEELRRQHREREAEEETRRLRKMVEEEEKQQRAKQKQIDMETERLRKIYGEQATVPSQSQGTRPPQTIHAPTHSLSAPILQMPFPPPPPPVTQQGHGPTRLSYTPPQRQLLPNGLYAQPQDLNASTSNLQHEAPVMHGGNRRDRSSSVNRLSKQASALW